MSIYSDISNEILNKSKYSKENLLGCVVPYDDPKDVDCK